MLLAITRYKVPSPSVVIIKCPARFHCNKECERTGVIYNNTKDLHDETKNIQSKAKVIHGDTQEILGDTKDILGDTKNIHGDTNKILVGNPAVMK